MVCCIALSNSIVGIHRDKLQRAEINNLNSQLTLARSIEDVRSIHNRISANGKQQSVCLVNTLIHMYGVYGSVKDARLAFDRVQNKDVHTYNAMIDVYVGNGKHTKALDLYKRMCFQIDPDVFTYTKVLEACSVLQMPSKGIFIHARIVVNGLENVESLQGRLMSMYIECHVIECAWLVFEKLTYKDVQAWNMMITAYAQNGHFEEALELYYKMDIQPNSNTVVSLLLACSCLEDLHTGCYIHSCVYGKSPGVSVENAVLDMYSRCGCTEKAWWVFQGMDVKDVVSWNIVMAMFVRCDRLWDAMGMYRRMEMEGFPPNAFTYTVLLGDVKAAEAMYERHMDMC